MEKVQDSLNLLGKNAIDKVTGFKGVITSISFDLYGCIQAVLHPGFDEKQNKMAEPIWFDTNRLLITNDVPVMDLPEFVRVKGPEPKTVNKS